MPITLKLPRRDGLVTPYTLTNRAPVGAPPGPITSRIGMAAVHVVADPHASINPTLEVALDWDATLRYRHYMWSLGLAVAEAMDTSQRGMGFDGHHLAAVLGLGDERPPLLQISHDIPQIILGRDDVELHDWLEEHLPSLLEALRLAGDAGDQGSRRNHNSLWNECAGRDQRPRSDARAVEDHRAHPDQRVILDDHDGRRMRPEGRQHTASVRRRTR